MNTLVSSPSMKPRVTRRLSSQPFVATHHTIGSSPSVSPGPLVPMMVLRPSAAASRILSNCWMAAMRWQWRENFSPKYDAGLSRCYAYPTLTKQPIDVALVLSKSCPNNNSLDLGLACTFPPELRWRTTRQESARPSQHHHHRRHQHHLISTILVSSASYTLAACCLFDPAQP